MTLSGRSPRPRTPTCHLGAKPADRAAPGTPTPRTRAAGAPGRRRGPPTRTRGGPRTVSLRRGPPTPPDPHPDPHPPVRPRIKTRSAHAARTRPEAGRARGVRPTLAPGTPRHESLGLGPQNLLSSYGQGPNFSKTATERSPATRPNGLRRRTSTVKISRQKDPNLAAESWELKRRCGRRKGRAQASRGAGRGAGRRKGRGEGRGSCKDPGGKAGLHYPKMLETYFY